MTQHKRILALHGVGSSAETLEKQTAALRRELGEGFEFVFMDGKVPWTRGPGPFFSYTESFAPRDVREALDDIENFVQDNGPFDGVLGFSLGASVAASYILDGGGRQHFSFAVFLSSVASFSPRESHHEEMISRLLGQANLQWFPDCDVTTLTSGIADETERAVILSLASAFISMKQIGAFLPGTDIRFLAQGGRPEMVPRILHPAAVEDRIHIPTVHMIGKADLPALIDQSRLVQALCSRPLTRTVQHPGGHAVPARRSDLLSLVSAVEWAAEEGARQLALDRLYPRGANTSF